MNKPGCISICLHRYNWTLKIFSWSMEWCFDEELVEIYRIVQKNFWFICMHFRYDYFWRQVSAWLICKVLGQILVWFPCHLCDVTWWCVQQMAYFWITVMIEIDNTKYFLNLYKSRIILAQKLFEIKNMPRFSMFCNLKRFRIEKS